MADLEAQKAIKDNMDVMLDIVMRIREDEEFAKSIYADCPRLQHLLDEKPDLRPIFEDPNLVLINFEQVYRDAGGVLPWDEPKEEEKKSMLLRIIQSPFFKVIRLLLVIKKAFSCIFGGGLALLTAGLAALFCCDPADAADATDGDDAGDDKADVKHDKNKEALNKAADHMEDPEVQAQMQELLQNDSEGLQMAIENDPELMALRDSNPLCAELMAEPETMRILTDPENLRGLGEAPGLIEADFADPNWAPEADIETGDAPPEAAPEVDKPETEADGEKEEEEEEEGILDDYELGEKDDNNPNAGKNNKNKQQNNQNKNNQNGGGGFFSSVGAGFTDMIASELVGVGLGEVTGGDDPVGDLMGGDGEAATNMATQASQVAQASEVVLSDDMAGGLEDGLDEIEDTHDERNDNRSRAAAGAAGAGAAGAGVGAAGLASSRGDAPASGEENEKEEKKGRFGVIGSWASAVKTAGQEYVATTLLGDDIGEMVAERMEGDEDKDEAGKEEDEENQKKSDPPSDPPSSRRR